MIVSTQNQLDGYQVVETLGLVQGSTIRARHIGTDILAVLRNIVGGEVHEYTKMLAESREQSLDRMIANAEEAGANAVLCMRFATSMVMTGMAEFLAYGTAVKIEPVS